MLFSAPLHQEFNPLNDPQQVSAALLEVYTSSYNGGF